MPRVKQRGFVAVAAVALALAAALVLGSATAPAVLLVAVVLAQGLVVAGWHRSLDVPDVRGGAVVGAAAALGCDLLVLVEAGDRPLSALPGLLAVAVLAALVQQLARRDGRDRLTASLAATVSLTSFAGLGATYLAASDGEDGLGLVSAAAVAAALVVAGDAARHRLGWPPLLGTLVVAGAAALAALAVVALDGVAGGPAAAVAATAAVVAWAATVLVARTAAPDLGVTAGLPIVLAGPVAYVLGRLLVG
jgi:hypothetical protein